MAKKKDFKNVNDLFISQLLGEEEPEPVQQETTPAADPAGQEPKAPEQETKSARLQLLIRPSTNKALAKEAKRRRISKNELINQILEEHTKGVR